MRTYYIDDAGQSRSEVQVILGQFDSMTNQLHDYPAKDIINALTTLAGRLDFAPEIASFLETKIHRVNNKRHGFRFLPPASLFVLYFLAGECWRSICHLPITLDVGTHIICACGGWESAANRVAFVIFRSKLTRLVFFCMVQVPPSFKLPLLYLTDSILKNVAGPYPSLFGRTIVPLYCNSIKQVSPILFLVVVLMLLVLRKRKCNSCMVAERSGSEY